MTQTQWVMKYSLTQIVHTGYYSLHIEMQLVNETINPSTKAEMIIRLLKRLQIHLLSNNVKHLLVRAFQM